MARRPRAPEPESTFINATGTAGRKSGGSPAAATTVKTCGKLNCRRVSSATRNEPAMPPKRQMPSIHDTPVARPRVG